MRAWILGIALVSATGGGVAFVLAGKGEQSHCGPCLETKATPPVAEPDDACCPGCKPTPPTDSADVTDLRALLAGAADASRPRLSFDEPPFAPAATAVRELAPMPHPLTAAEVCPMPRPTSVTEIAPLPRPAK